MALEQKTVNFTEGTEVVQPTAIAGLGTIADEPTTVTNSGLKASVAANALTLTLTQKDGSTDPSASGPVNTSFPITTATGDYLVGSTESAITLTLPQGSTLALENAVEDTFFVYLIYNSGTPELAVEKTLLEEDETYSTVAITSGATSANVLYSTTLRTTQYVRVIGRIHVTNTGGNWGTPAKIFMGDYGQFNYLQSSVSIYDRSLLDNVSFSAALDGASGLDLALGINSNNLSDAFYKIGFKNVSATNTSYEIVQKTGTTQLNIPNGATFGIPSGPAFNLYIYALNNAGSIELAVSSDPTHDINKLHTTVAMSASATNFGALYSTTLRSNVAIARIGYMTIVHAGGSYGGLPTVALVNKEFDRLVEKRLRANNSTTSIIVGTTTIVHSTIAVQNNISYNNTTGVATIDVAGYYDAFAATRYSGNAGVGNVTQMDIKLNGTSVFQDEIQHPTAYTGYSRTLNCGGHLGLLKPGDTIRVDIFNNAGVQTATAGIYCNLNIVGTL